MSLGDIVLISGLLVAFCCGDKSAIISLFLFFIASSNAVLLNYIEIVLKKKSFWNCIEKIDCEWNWIIWLRIPLKVMNKNSIGKYDFEFHWMIWFWIPFKDMIMNVI